MKEKFIENGIEYVRNGEYYIPNLFTAFAPATCAACAALFFNISKNAIVFSYL